MIKIMVHKSDDQFKFLEGPPSAGPKELTFPSTKKAEQYLRTEGEDTHIYLIVNLRKKMQVHAKVQLELLNVD